MPSLSALRREIALLERSRRARRSRQLRERIAAYTLMAPPKPREPFLRF